MYYKITDQSSEVYQKLHQLRTRELQIEEENKKAIQSKTGMTWNAFLGDTKQQQFRRVTQYAGFMFNQTDQVDPKIWKRDKKYPAIWVPNTRTKAGREMDQFLSNGLDSSPYGKVLEILGLERLTRFTFPFVEICEDAIILYLGDQHQPKDPNVVEITFKEFQGLQERLIVKKA
jgi:hypothetical protein